LELHKDTHKLVVNQRELYLTGAEWKILVYLAEHENVVVTRERILSECLNYFFEGSERTIDTHIANLRSKLGGSNWIGTVRGFGYRFNGTRSGK
jgi:two-component system phosphate regulon response regulator PhoB